MLDTVVIRHYLSAPQYKALLPGTDRSLKSKIRTADQVLAFSTKLDQASRNYAALLTPDHEAWGDLNVEARADVESLMRLRIEQNRPLLLAAMEKFEPTELKALLRFLVSWTVRGLIVGGIGAGVTETAYANAAVRVREGSVKTVPELFDLVKDIVPSDERFKSDFASYSPPTNKIARYYLIALERRKDGKSEPELVPNEDEEKVNLEHVLPRNAKPEEWEHFKDVDRGEWASRLGNLVLLQKTKNLKLGNKAFSDKKPILLRSDLKLTKMVGEQDEWSPDAIAARQAELAGLAADVWPSGP